MTRPKYAAININFDSLGEAYGFPTDYRDPSFHEVADRLLDIADRYGFKYSIYIIAKDLERPENRAAVKRWAELGHEIGNHTYSHPVNLGTLPPEQMRDEITRAHRLIEDTVGKAPKGFIAPVWATGEGVLKTLIELGYEYDTSAFPSWLMYPSIAKITLNHLGNERMGSFLRRKDFGFNLLGSRQPYLSEGSLFAKPVDPSQPHLTVLPIPTTPARVACWHTLAFMFDFKRYEAMVQSCLRSLDTFYYLLHPADMVAPEDLDPNMKLHLERVEVPVSTKVQYLERAIEMILADGREIVTMQQLAQHAHDRLSLGLHAAAG